MGFGKANVYENLVAELKRLIELGVLQDGEKLPSVRMYAVERRVNPNTVAKAYATLEADGYLRVQPKQGAFVCFGSQAPIQVCDEIEQQVSAWKNSGVAKERLQCVIAQVYGGENND